MQTRYLEPLKYPVHFVCGYLHKWPELLVESALDLPNPDEIFRRVQSNEDCWIVLTYIHLKKAGLNISISDRFIKDAICVVSSLDFGIRNFSFSSFVVGCRGDGHDNPLCDFTIVQNPTMVASDKNYFLPLWPQPGLLPRNSDRGSRIKTIVYKGASNNLHEPFRSNWFQDEHTRLGVKLILDVSPATWHDYRYADLVLAARNLTKQDSRIKPPSKLINAWAAGVPALLGPEVAFECLRKSSLDYFEIKTPHDVLQTVSFLIQNPEIYKATVENGFKRFQEFNIERLTIDWYTALSVPITMGYLKWREKKYINKFFQFTIRSYLLKQSKADAAYHRVHGERILTGEIT